MKADLTRNTFLPLKHFSRVLQQQGRVQLDADSNEQTSILLHYLRSLTADLINPAAGPAGNVGFAITSLSPAPAQPDFRIGFGHYYVNGLLCEADFTPISLVATTTKNVYQVMNWSSDFEQSTVPYYELFDASPSSGVSPRIVQITVSDRAQNQITFPDPADLSGFTIPMLRRVITYLHQPDFVFSNQSGAASPPAIPAADFVQVYLDVWERAITYAEDDSIREVALGGPDTCARSKVVWQVKCQVGQGDGANQCGVPPAPAPRGWLQAMAKQASPSTNPCIINPSASYTGPENQLYRVEINRGGAAGTTPGKSATFKWSRENGAVVYPIAGGGGTTKVVVESLGRDDRFGLSEGNLVEVQDDRSVLLNLARNLLSVQSVDSTSLTVTLGGTPDSTIGSDETLHPLLRRWDQTAGDLAEGGLTLDTDNAAFVQEGVWLTLEDGIQIRFQPADPAQPSNSPLNNYLTGDYWLIPARTATGDVEWPKVTDANGNPETDSEGNPVPLALPPHGINHYYAPLAVVTPKGNTISVQSDCRSQFGPITSLVSSDR
jgi:hypothetical protein